MEGTEERDEFDDLVPAIAVLEAVTGYVEVASLLCKECNISFGHFLDLCKALEHACEVFGDIRYESGRRASMRSNLKVTRAFHKSMVEAHRAFGLLDPDTRIKIIRVVENNHRDAFFETRMGHLGPMSIEIDERRLSLGHLLAEIADAARQCIDRVKLPPGKPANDALKGFVAALREFWVEKLGRPFYDNFQEDFEFSDDPNRGAYTPVNDASRFIVGAVQRLIAYEVDVATCRWMMRAVDGAK